MAVYMFDEYAAAYPEQQLTLFNKFLNYEKNLHEMSVAEINAILAENDGFTEGTATKMKFSFKHYLKYLSANGVKCDVGLANKISFPIKQVHYYIFSTDDIRYYWNLVTEDIAEIEKKFGRKFFPELFYKDIAVGILAFYGFTVEQILSLPRWDITEEGIKGYDTKFTKEDIADLIRYRDLKVMQGNNIYLLGDKYIRTVKTNPNEEAPEEAVTRVASRLRKANSVSDKYKFLKSVLTYDNLYRLGVFDRIYRIEKDNNYSMVIKGTTPQWFLEAANNDSKYTKYNYKRDYIAYRTERDTTKFVKESIKNTTVTDEHQNNSTTTQIKETVIDNLERELTAITTEMAQLSQRLESVKQVVSLLKK